MLDLEIVNIVKAAAAIKRKWLWSSLTSDDVGVSGRPSSDYFAR
jgi:hypothetical protein